jgi:hypothetical protein
MQTYTLTPYATVNDKRGPSCACARELSCPSQTLYADGLHKLYRALLSAFQCSEKAWQGDDL